MSVHNLDPHMGPTTMPDGTEVASYASYPEAQAGVDYLVEQGFNVKDITIVGTDLHLVEHITGRLTPVRAAFSGATSGLMWGGFLGLLLSFANQGLPAVGWLTVGAAGGALFGMSMALVSYVMRRGNRDFVSHSHVIASRYALLASQNAQHAFDLLQKTPGNQRRPARPTPRPRRNDTDGPTEYGSRPDEKPRFGVRLTNPTTQEHNNEETTPQPQTPTAQPDPTTTTDTH